jgi:hypothetical protein
VDCSVCDGCKIGECPTATCGWNFTSTICSNGTSCGACNPNGGVCFDTAQCASDFCKACNGDFTTGDCVECAGCEGCVDCPVCDGCKMDCDAAAPCAWNNTNAICSNSTSCGACNPDGGVCFDTAQCASDFCKACNGDFTTGDCVQCAGCEGCVDCPVCDGCKVDCASPASNTAQSPVQQAPPSPTSAAGSDSQISSLAVVLAIVLALVGLPH